MIIKILRKNTCMISAANNSVLAVCLQKMRRGIPALRFSEIIFLSAVLLLAVGVLAVSYSDTYASCPNRNGDGSTCLCATDLEPPGKVVNGIFYNYGLMAEALSPGSGPGSDIINAIFNTINNVLSNVSQTFYGDPLAGTGIIGNSNYQGIITALVFLYVAVYGILIVFGLAPLRVGEIVTRLIKISIIWSVVGQGGWNFFSQWISLPILHTTNDLIASFSQAGAGNSFQNAVSDTGGLSPGSMGSLTGPMTLVFSLTFVVMMASFLTLVFGPLIIVTILWGVVEFLFMLVGAMITYVRSMVGLAFLLGLAPIFFPFVLFEKTRQIFMGWTSQVLAFFMQPVLLFAFLGFYAVILMNLMSAMIFNTDIHGHVVNNAIGILNYCYVTFFRIGVFDVHWWRPTDTYQNLAVTNIGQYPNSCGAQCGQGMDWEGPSPVQLADVFYFLLLTHLGKNLSKFIEQISNDITGGTGPGVVRGSAVGRWASNTFFGGRGPGSVAFDFGKAAAGKVNAAVQKRGGYGAVARNAGNKMVGAAKFATRTALHPRQAVGKAKAKVVNTARTAKDNVVNAAQAVGHGVAAGAQVVGHGFATAGRNVVFSKGTATRNVARNVGFRKGTTTWKVSRNVRFRKGSATRRMAGNMKREVGADLQQIQQRGQKIGQNLQRMGTQAATQAAQDWNSFNNALGQIGTAVGAIPGQLTKQNISAVSHKIRKDIARDLSQAGAKLGAAVQATPAELGREAREIVRDFVQFRRKALAWANTPTPGPNKP